MALVQVAGIAFAYFGTMPGYLGMAEIQQGGKEIPGRHLPIFRHYLGGLMLRKTAPVWDRWSYWMFPFTTSSVWGSGWLGYFVPNILRSVYHLFWGSVTFGLLPIRTAWDAGWSEAWQQADALYMAHSASGLGPARAILVSIMPHGLIESPAFWLICALALRTGLVWLWRVPGHSRVASLQHQVRSFPVVLAVVVPALLVSALLETYAAPTVWNRYFIGIGLSPGMTGEARLITGNPRGFDALAESSVSPDGEALACTDGSQRLLWRGDIDGAHWAPELEASQWTLLSPSWSPDSKEIAVVWSPGEKPGRLVAFDTKARKHRTISGGPVGRYLSAAWSHHGHTVAVVTMSVSTEPGEQDRGPTTIWLVDATSSRWTKLVTLPAVSRAAIVPGLAWRPDDEEIAFARRAGSRPETKVWDIQDGAAGGGKSGLNDSRPETGIWKVGTNGAGLRQVTRGPTDALPSWSPDGRWIAFISRPAGGDSDRFRAMTNECPLRLGEIGLVHPDGTGRVDHIARADPYSPISWVDPARLVYERNETLILGSPRVLAGGR
jgi:hypothetical protein